MLSVSLLGAPLVLLDGQSLQIPRRKSRALLYYLAAQPQPASREALLGFFWPDAPRPAALQTLRSTLYGLRKALGAALETGADTVGLAGDSQVDFRQFEAALAPRPVDIATLQVALDLYRGDFLADFSLPDTQPFEDWMTVERERLRRLAVQALNALSAVYQGQGDFGAAMEALERALAFNPLQEDLQRELIRLAYLSGDRPGSIRRYDQLRRLLDEELGVPPMPETRALYDAIITEKPLEAATRRRDLPVRLITPAAPARLAAVSQKAAVSQPAAAGHPAAAPGVLPFTGREEELRTLNELVGSHRLVLIEGEPGIGKTRLAEEFLRAGQALVLAGSGRELEQHLPYGPLVEALRGLSRRPDWPARFARLRAGLPAVWLEETSRLLPELAGPQTPARPAEEARLWEGVHQLLCALAAQGPVILFLDDLHWVDASTLALLGYLLRQAHNAPLSFLAAAQPVAPRSRLAALLSALIRADRLARLHLERLSPGAVATLARSLSPASAGLLGEWLQRGSEGNPYFLAELVSEARLQKILLPDGQLTLGDDPGLSLVPATIYSLIQSRLARLSEAARRLLDSAVAAGREFDFELVAQAAGLAEAEALDGLDELAAAHLIHPEEAPGDAARPGTRFAFNHSLIMEVAYREVGELRHRMLHRQLAEALEKTHPGETALAGLIAWHFAEGNDFERAWPYAFLAGQAAARLAGWTEAADFYQQSLRGARGEQRLAVWTALGNALVKQGQFARASEVFNDALDAAQASGKTDQVDPLRLALARSLLTQARFGEVIDLAQQVLAPEAQPAPGSQPGPDRALAVAAQLVWGTALSLEGSNLEEAAGRLTAARALVTSEGGPSGVQDLVNLAHIQFELGSVLAQQGDLPGAVALYRQALEAGAQVPGDEAVEQLILAYNNLAYHLHLLGEPDAGPTVEAGLRLAKEKGFLGLDPYLLSTRGEIALGQGDLDAAEMSFQQGLEIAERLAMPERVAGLTANLGLVANRRGQAARAIHRLSTALGQADALGTRHLAAQIRLWLAPLLPVEEGRALLAEARRMAKSSGRQRLLEQALQVEAALDQAGGGSETPP